MMGVPVVQAPGEAGCRRSLPKEPELAAFFIANSKIDDLKTKIVAMKSDYDELKAKCEPLYESENEESDKESSDNNVENGDGDEEKEEGNDQEESTSDQNGEGDDGVFLGAEHRIFASHPVQLN